MTSDPRTHRRRVSDRPPPSADSDGRTARYVRPCCGATLTVRRVMSAGAPCIGTPQPTGTGACSRPTTRSLERSVGPRLTGFYIQRVTSGAGMAHAPPPPPAGRLRRRGSGDGGDNTPATGSGPQRNPAFAFRAPRCRHEETLWRGGGITLPRRKGVVEPCIRCGVGVPQQARRPGRIRLYCPSCRLEVDREQKRDSAHHRQPLRACGGCGAALHPRRRLCDSCRTARLRAREREKSRRKRARARPPSGAPSHRPLTSTNQEKESP